MFAKRLKTGLPALSVFALSLALYLTALPSKLSWINNGSDSGDFLAALLTGGIPHPTGYPAYLLLGSLFMRLPFGSPVWRAALLSACAAAAASALLCAWLQKQLSQLLRLPLAATAAAVTALSLSAAPLIFSQAVIVEVYGLQSLFFMLAFYWLDALSAQREPGDNTAAAALLALCFGFGLGNHVTGVLLAPPLLYFLALEARRRRWKRLALQVAAAAAGLCVYFVLPLRALQNPPINWGDPRTLSGFLWLVSADPYQGLLFTTPAAQVLERIAALANYLLKQFGVVGIFLGVIGLVQRPTIRLPFFLSMLWIALVYSGFSIGYSTSDSTAYLIPFFIIWAAWIGLGIGTLAEIRWRSLPVGLAILTLFALTTALQIPATVRENNPARNPQAEDSAARILNEIPNDAFFFTTADLDTFPLWYFHFGLGQRPDIRLIVKPLTQFAWYRDTIKRVYPDLTLPEEYPGEILWKDALPALNPQRPVCRSHIDNTTDAIVTYSCVP